MHTAGAEAMDALCYAKSCRPLGSFCGPENAWLLVLTGRPSLQIVKLLLGLLRGVLRFLVRELGRLMRFERKLHGLLGVFVSGQVIFFSMMHCGGAMSVRGLFVKFSGALMRIVWHDDPFLAKRTDVTVLA
jgi:hypothetical protein